MVTLKDIAKASGVSTATVSCVVNEGPRVVLPATRERVLKAIEELGYYPNAAARSLMGKRTQTFGVVFPQVVGSPLDNQYFSAVLSGIIDAATQRKQIAMLFTGMTWAEAERSLPIFCDGRCDGFLFVAPPPQSRLIETVCGRGTKVVVIGTRSYGPTVSTMDIDNVESIQLVVHRLVELGHRRIGMLHSDSASTSIPERVQGFLEGIAEHGIPLVEAPVFSFRHPQETAYDGALRLLQSEEGSRITALVCTQDSTASLAIDAAMDLGKRVPEDLAVFGFDDLPLTTTHSPTISTVRQPLRQIGAEAASLLFDLIEDDKLQPSERLFEVELVERASTGPPLG